MFYYNKITVLKMVTNSAVLIQHCSQLELLLLSDNA